MCGRRDGAVHVARIDLLKKGDVVVRVKLRHVLHACQLRSKHLHVLVNAIVKQQRMRHADSVRFHGVAGAVIKVSDLVVIKVAHPVLGGRHDKNAM